MNLTAINDQGKKIYATEKGLRARCERCGGIVISVIPEIPGRISFWRHWDNPASVEGYCPGIAKWDREDGQSEWHKRFQSLVVPDYVECKNPRGPPAGEQDYYRADILGNNNTVIELQHSSSIPTKEIQARQNYYDNMIWVLDAENFLKDPCICAVPDGSTKIQFSISGKVQRIRDFDPARTFIQLPCGGLFKLHHIQDCSEYKENRGKAIVYGTLVYWKDFIDQYLSSVLRVDLPWDVWTEEYPWGVWTGEYPNDYPWDRSVWEHKSEKMGPDRRYDAPWVRLNLGKDESQEDIRNRCTTCYTYPSCVFDMWEWKRYRKIKSVRIEQPEWYIPKFDQNGDITDPAYIVSVKTGDPSYKNKINNGNPRYVDIEDRVGELLDTRLYHIADSYDINITRGEIDEFENRLNRLLYSLNRIAVCDYWITVPSVSGENRMTEPDYLFSYVTEFSIYRFFEIEEHKEIFARAVWDDICEINIIGSQRELVKVARTVNLFKLVNIPRTCPGIWACTMKSRANNPAGWVYTTSCSRCPKHDRIEKVRSYELPGSLPNLIEPGN